MSIAKDYRTAMKLINSVPRKPKKNAVENLIIKANEYSIPYHKNIMINNKGICR